MMRIVRKDDMTGVRAALVRVASIASAIVFSMLLVWILGYAPGTRQAIVEYTFAEGQTSPAEGLHQVAF